MHELSSSGFVHVLAHNRLDQLPLIYWFAQENDLNAVLVWNRMLDLYMLWNAAHPHNQKLARCAGQLVKQAQQASLLHNFILPALVLAPSVHL